jgi:uracil phosphoribosyltransferase
MIHILGDKNSLLNQFIAEIRDEKIQKDSMRFRKNLERIGEIFAYEISKELEYANQEIKTPLGIANINMLCDKIVLAALLRSALPFHQGCLNFFDKAENAFITAYRKYQKDGEFDLYIDYVSSPDIENKIAIICDPLLATGSSLVMAYNALIANGQPKHTYIASIIAAKDGINYVRKHLPMNQVSLWVGAIDDELTVKSYVVPGLGDVGDLAFGEKSQQDFS